MTVLTVLVLIAGVSTLALAARVVGVALLEDAADREPWPELDAHAASTRTTPSTRTRPGSLP